MRVSWLPFAVALVALFSDVCNTFSPSFPPSTHAAARLGLARTFESAYSEHIPSWLLMRCSQLGFLEPTVVQEIALEHILAGRDVVLQAQTGHNT